MRGRVLIVDDDEDTRVVLGLKLDHLGFRTEGVASAPEALAALEEQDFEVVLSDYDMPGMDGVALCGEVQSRYPEVPVIILTGHQRLEVAIAALKHGAYDFIAKPFEIEFVSNALDRALERRSMQQEVQRLKSELAGLGLIEGMVGESLAMRGVYHLIDQASQAKISVLVTGETGTGKEVVAQALHKRSPRADGPFFALNCAAVPEHLLESELFGHVKGAFTDAKSDRKGIFLQANGGTLFLDEIGDMPLSLQSKLLRALQERKVRPIGSEKETSFDVRVVAATNQDLAQRIEEGSFRQDLYYRLNVIHIRLPPLREREQDILLLAQYFLEKSAPDLGKDVHGITPETAAKLLNYSWPGNVRELQNCMERAVVVTSHDHIRVMDLPEELRELPSAPPLVTSTGPESLESLAEMEQRHITRVLAATGGNKLRASKILGVDRTTLYRKLERYQIRWESGGDSDGA